MFHPGFFDTPLTDILKDNDKKSIDNIIYPNDEPANEESVKLVLFTVLQSLSKVINDSGLNGNTHKYRQWNKSE